MLQGATNQSYMPCKASQRCRERAKVGEMPARAAAAAVCRRAKTKTRRRWWKCKSGGESRSYAPKRVAQKKSFKLGILYYPFSIVPPRYIYYHVWFCNDVE